MSKINFKPGNMLYPLPCVMVTCIDKDLKPNIITVAWAGTICTNPPMVSISIKKERYSYNLIKESKEFVINLVTDKLVYAADYCGCTSGANVDKIKNLKLELIKSEIVKSPSLKLSPVSIECKVSKIIPLGSHDMFIADVVNVAVDDAYMDSHNKFSLNDSKLVTYSHGEYFTLGAKQGHFGFSVKKK